MPSMTAAGHQRCCTKRRLKRLWPPSRRAVSLCTDHRSPRSRTILSHWRVQRSTDYTLNRTDGNTRDDETHEPELSGCSTEKLVVWRFDEAGGQRGEGPPPKIINADDYPQ